MNEYGTYTGGSHPLRFGKRFRLRHKSLVNALFAEGKSLCDYPVRMVYRFTSRPALEKTFLCGMPERIDRVQMMVTVPKKKRRHAVDRVLMRRRIREAFRINRLPLAQAMAEKDLWLETAFIYQHNDNVPYREIERKMISLIGRLIRKADAFNPDTATSSE